MSFNFLIALCLFLSCLSGKLAFDLHLYQSRKKNRHTLGPAIVLAVIVACSWLAGWLGAPMWLFGFWALFDVLYALLIGQKWYYVGTTAKLDKLQRQNPALMWLKFAGVPISIILYIML